MRLNDLLFSADHYLAANTKSEPQTLKEPMGDPQEALAYQEALAAEYDQGETYQEFLGL